MSRRARTAEAPVAGEVPAGRPAAGESRAPLKTISFCADPETLAALAALVARLPEGLIAKRSVALRQAILAAAASPVPPAPPPPTPSAKASSRRPK